MDKKITQEQQRQIQLDILASIDDFCKQHEIHYSLAFGTLLGAVRHHGFIPWDDDIDIMMTRDDYEKFRSLYDSSRYPLADLRNSKSHPVSMGKIYDSQTYFYYQGNLKRKYGLFIDVFPFDNIPDNLDTRMQWLKRIKKYVKYNQLKNNSFAFIHNLPTFRAKIQGYVVKLFFSAKDIHSKLENMFSQYHNIKSSYLGVPAVMVMSKEYMSKIFPNYIFDEYITLDFEGRPFPCIKDYDLFLKIFYGEYMQLPPVEKRIGKHGITAYFK